MLFIFKEHLLILNRLFSIAVTGISTVLTISFSRGGVSAYFYLYTFIITVVFPFLFQWALFGPSGLKTAFTAGFKKAASMKELEKSRLFFTSYAKVIRLSALLPVVTGTAAIPKRVTPGDYTLMGPNFAMALMFFLYAVILHAAIVSPFSVILRRRIIELNIEI
jgi:hypothetical protein